MYINKLEKFYPLHKNDTIRFKYKIKSYCIVKVVSTYTGHIYWSNLYI